MALHCSVSCLVLIVSFRRYKHGCHHCKRTECGRDHITHHVSVIVLASPDISSLRFHHARYCVIDQCVKILDSCLFKLLVEFCIIDFLENIFKCMIIFFGNRIFCCKPQILLRVKGIGKTASGETLNGLVQIVHALNDTFSVKIMYELFCLTSVLGRIHKLHFTRTRYLHFRSLINITICMPCNGDRFLPVFHARLNSLYNDRRTEYCSVEDCTDCSIRAFPHLF